MVSPTPHTSRTVHEYNDPKKGDRLKINEDLDVRIHKSMLGKFLFSTSMSINGITYHVSKKSLLKAHESKEDINPKVLIAAFRNKYGDLSPDEIKKFNKKIDKNFNGDVKTAIKNCITHTYSQEMNSFLVDRNSLSKEELMERFNRNIDALQNLPKGQGITPDENVKAKEIFAESLNFHWEDMGNEKSNIPTYTTDANSHPLQLEGKVLERRKFN